MEVVNSPYVKEIECSCGSTIRTTGIEDWFFEYQKNYLYICVECPVCHEIIFYEDSEEPPTVNLPCYYEWKRRKDGAR
jgi:hypothetical protein